MVRSEGLYVNEKSTDTSWDFFYYQHTFIQVHCVHSSTYVTDIVSIVSEVRVFIGQGTLSLPHTTVPFDPPLSTPRIHFPVPSLHTA